MDNKRSGFCDEIKRRINPVNACNWSVQEIRYPSYFPQPSAHMGKKVPPKFYFVSTKLHRITSQRTVTLIFTAVRT